MMEELENTQSTVEMKEYIQFDTALAVCAV